MRVDHGVVQVWGCSTNLHRYARGARTLESVRVRHRFPCVCLLSLIVDQSLCEYSRVFFFCTFFFFRKNYGIWCMRWKCENTTLPTRKAYFTHSPGFSYSTFFPETKTKSEKKRESEGKAGVCEPSTRMNAEQAWAQSMRREHAIKIRMRVEL